MLPGEFSMLQMLLNLGIGWFIGFFFGFGCSLAVIYQIYLGGYRKAVEDSLREPQPRDYLTALHRAKRSLASGNGA
jgi:hypothetical protein